MDEKLCLWLAALVLVSTACVSINQTAASPTSSSEPTAMPSSPATQGGACQEELIPPTITEIQPAQGVPGSELTVIGSGGFTQDGCGGYNESAREFPLYLDKVPAGNLLCYVHHCEGKITLASTILPGSHCLSTQKDVCEYEFQVPGP